MTGGHLRAEDAAGRVLGKAEGLHRGLPLKATAGGSSWADWSQVSPRWRRGGIRPLQADGFGRQPQGLKTRFSSRDGQAVVGEPPRPLLSPGWPQRQGESSGSIPLLPVGSARGPERGTSGPAGGARPSRHPPAPPS
ncbi:uncharacterized protein ACBT57_016875 isoform 1-T1 [Dama dama]